MKTIEDAVMRGEPSSSSLLFSMTWQKKRERGCLSATSLSIPRFCCFSVSASVCVLSVHRCCFRSVEGSFGSSLLSQCRPGFSLYLSLYVSLCCLSSMALPLSLLFDSCICLCASSLSAVCLRLSSGVVLVLRNRISSRRNERSDRKSKKKNPPRRRETLMVSCLCLLDSVPSLLFTHPFFCKASKAKREIPEETCRQNKRKQRRARAGKGIEDSNLLLLLLVSEHRKLAELMHSFTFRCSFELKEDASLRLCHPEVAI